MTDCDDTLLPNEAAYSGILGNRNVLWGQWDFINPPQNFSDAGTMVHVEAGPFAAGEYTFYGRFNNFDGSDGREALGNVWGIRFNNNVAFDAGTSLRVWREPRSVPMPMPCPVASLPTSQPGAAQQIVVFDESEDVVALVTGAPSLPLVTQRVRVNSAALPVPFDFGWLFLNLNSGPGTTKADLKQSYVSAVSDVSGRFSAGNDAFRMAHPAAQQPNPQFIGAPPFPAVPATEQGSER